VRPIDDRDHMEAVADLAEDMMPLSLEDPAEADSDKGVVVRQNYGSHISGSISAPGASGPTGTRV
jgi:hypothetical protein